MLLAADVLRLVSGSLQDLEPGMEARWPWGGGEEDSIGLMDFLNAGLRAIALQRPDCCAVTESIRLEPGMLQHLPTRRRNGASKDATGFCELVRNMGADGETPGRAITSVQPEVLLTWADYAKPCCCVDNFAYDRAANGLVYYVYPPVPDGRDVYVEATYYVPPRQITDANQCLGVNDSYAEALVHYILAAVLAGDNEASAAQGGKAVYHQQMFQQCMGSKAQVDTVWPKAKSSAGAA
ncbi:DUF6682 family protein [uncultured Desulfovibrio sp.]|uniref:phage adaptor protein n=1 Tax=uncultured Desulfovibrio sp. TaxID=167968 RepID=UPI00261BB92A|nr:DUF6682 family protein [uncultured Desulfovibrio sp.]